MILISSSPNAPPSPACGFRPAPPFCARQTEVAAGLRGEFDGERDFFRRQLFGNGLDGDVNRGERDAQPASALIRAEQHHGGAFGAGEFGKEFGLTDNLWPARMMASLLTGAVTSASSSPRRQRWPPSCNACHGAWRPAPNRPADFPAAGAARDCDKKSSRVSVAGKFF